MNKVLLVDDMMTVLMTEKMMLAAHGYEVTTALNGRDALAKVAEFEPDLILCDINMPVMNGVEFCKALRADTKHRGIPLIIVSTEGESDRMEECFRAGCTDYVTKPINKSQLLTKVRMHLTRRNGSRFGATAV